MLKKVVGIVLIMSMLLSFVNVFAGVASYTEKNGGITITSWDKTDSYVIEVPQKISGKNVTAIGSGAFADCVSVCEIVIPDTVKEIAADAFLGCPSLKSITVSAQNPYFTTVNGALYSKDKTKLIKFCDYSLSDIALPSTVKHIDDYAFYDMYNLQCVSSSANILSVGAYAFYGCSSLDSISLSAVTAAGEYAFCGCSALLNADLSSLNNIPKAMFYNCSYLQGVVLSPELANIAALAFAGCFSVNIILIPQNTAVEKDAFFGCNATLYCSNKGLEYAKANGLGYILKAYDGSVPVKSISVKNTSITAKIGNSFRVSYSIEPTNAQVKDVYFISSNEDIVYIDDGRVYPKSAGVATVSIISVDGNKTATITVNVTDRDAPLQSEHPYKSGETSKYSYTVAGNPEKIAVTFSNDTYVEDGEDFIIVSDKEGNTVGTYTAGMLSNKTVVLNGDTVNVSIVADRDIAYYGFCITRAVDIKNINLSTEIKLDKSELSLDYGESYSFKCTTTPTNAIKDIRYFSSDESVITVDENGVLYALNDGTAYIMAVDALSGKIFKCNVTVNKNAYNGMHYIVNNSKVTLTYYDGEEKDLVIPDQINGMPVCTISNGAFMYSPTLQSVKIPSSVAFIAEDAFGGCVGLKSFTVDENNANYSSVNGLLYNKDKTVLISFPAGITGNASVENGTKTINSNAFYMCSSITSVTIPSSVTSIETGAFDFCESLQAIFYQGKSYSAIGGCLYSADGKRLLVVPCAKSGEFTVAEGTVEIDNNAFFSCFKITSVVLPQTLQKVNGAFSQLSSLEKITVSSSNTYFTTSKGVLYSKDKKTIISVPCATKGTYSVLNGVLTIGQYAFANCEDISGVLLPLSVKTIEKHAFYGAQGLSSLILPKSITAIGDYAFDNCSNLNVFAPENITSIGQSRNARLFCKGATASNAKKNGYTVTEILYACNDTASAVLFENVPNGANLNVKKVTGGKQAQVKSLFKEYSPVSYEISFDGYVTEREYSCVIFCDGNVEEVYAIHGNSKEKVYFTRFDNGIVLSVKGGIYAFLYSGDTDDQSGISLKTMPNKIKYKYGEKFDSAGMQLYYKNFAGIVSTVSSGFKCSAALDSFGDNAVNVEYNGLKLSFNVTVTADPLSGKANISGDGKIGSVLTLKIENLNQSIPYEIIWYRNKTQISAAKNALSYKLTAADSGADISVQIKATQGFNGTIVTNSIKVELTELISEKYKINSDNIISGISESTTWADVLKTLNIKQNVKAYNKTTELKESDLVTTGTHITLYSDDTVVHQITVVVTGDINGDGKISLIDFANMKAYMLGDKKFASFDKYAADVNGDGKLSLIDFAQFKAHMLGDITIKGKEY